MNQLLSVAVETAEQAEHFVGNTFGERAMYALSHTAVGMLIIFAVLAVIWAVLAVFKVVFGEKSEKKEKAPVSEKKAAPAPVATPAPAPAPVAPASSDEEIVAAITAAITLMRESDGVTGTFRVVSFRRTGGARPWNQA